MLVLDDIIRYHAQIHYPLSLSLPRTPAPSLLSSLGPLLPKNKNPKPQCQGPSPSHLPQVVVDI